MIVFEQDYKKRISDIINGTTSKEMPETAPAISTFMSKFRPADESADHDRMYSTDVVVMLEDICTPTLNDVTTVLIYLGYKLTMLPDNYTIYWAVLPIDGSHWDDAHDPDDYPSLSRDVDGVDK